MAILSSLDDIARIGSRLGRVLRRSGGDEAVAAAEDIGRAVRQAVKRSPIAAGPTATRPTLPTIGQASARLAGQSPFRAAGQTMPLSAAPKAAAAPRGIIKRAVLGPAGRPVWRQALRAGGAGLGLATITGLVNKRGEEVPAVAPLDFSGIDLTMASPTDLRLQRLQGAYDTAEQQLLAEQEALNQMLGQSAAADANYQQMLQNYRANTMRDIQSAYGRSADEALRAAQEIERGGLMAREGITEEGATTAAALQALAEQPAQAGTGMFTGLVPVTGDVAEAPQAAVNAADIAASAAQRGVNITRDDLRAAAAMAPMVSEAYGRQVDSQTAMAMALAQIAGEKERAQTQFEQSSRISQQRSELALSRAAQEDAIIAEALSVIAPENFQDLVITYQDLSRTPEGQGYLAARGIDSFAKYVEATLGPETTRLLREVGGGTGSR